MANRDFYTDINLNKQSLLNYKANPLTTAGQTTLSGTLSATDSGLVSWDTTLNKLMVWNGTTFVNAIPSVAGSMVYLGTTTSLTTIPATTIVGSTYVYTGLSGSLTWSGVTFSPSSVVEPNDLLIFRTPTQVDVVQANTGQATETVTGTSKVATQTQTNVGTADDVIITPLKLEQRLTNRNTPKSFLLTGLNLTANTAFTISFPTVATNKDAFSVSLKTLTGSEFEADIDAVNTAGFTVTSNVALTGVTAFVTYL